MEREQGLHMLAEGSVQLVFSVDMLNEGIDIPSLDLLLFLRPTESPVVFFTTTWSRFTKSSIKKPCRCLRLYWEL